jgi:hypothetical protein
MDFLLRITTPSMLFLLILSNFDLRAAGRAFTSFSAA